MRPTARTGAVLTAETRTLTFDVSLRESANRVAQVTRHEVEDGAPVTDHVRPQPVSLTLDVIASTSPLRATPDAQRDRQFRRDVEEIWRGRELCSVLCELGSFEGLVITSVQDGVDATTGEAFAAVIVLEEIRRAVRVVQLTPPDPATERRAQPAQDAGSQQGEATPEDGAAAQVETERGSMLYQLSGGTDESAASLGARFSQAVSLLTGAP